MRGIRGRREGERLGPGITKVRERRIRKGEDEREKETEGEMGTKKKRVEELDSPPSSEAYSFSYLSLSYESILTSLSR